MKVLIVSREYPPAFEGGISRRLEKMVPRLLNRGVEIGIVSFGGSSIAGEKVYSIKETSKIMYTRSGEPEAFDLPNVINDIFRLDRQASRIAVAEKYDLLQVEEPVFGPFLETSLPKLVTVHTTQMGTSIAYLRLLKEPRQMKRAMFSATFGILFDWICFAKFNRIVAISQNVKDQVTSYYRVSPSKIEIVPNGIDIEEENGSRDQSDTELSKLMEPKKTITYTYAGRLVDFKRVDVFIRALSILKRKWQQDFTAYIAGKGPNDHALRKLSRDLSVAENVFFTGHLDSVALRHILQNSDVFVSPTEYEGWGLAVYEAGAYGCALVVTKIPSFLHFLTDRKNALLFEPGNPEDLANKLLELTEDKALLFQLQQNAKKLTQGFKWESSIEKQIKIYSEMLKTS